MNILSTLLFLQKFNVNHDNMSTYASILLWVVPGFMVLMIIEVLYGHFTDKQTYSFMDTLSSLSSGITNVLKDSLGFQGLIVTDALNMGGVANLENNGLKAAQAGCDQLLMPVDEEKVLLNILELIEIDQNFRNEIYDSAKKIIRLKICLGKLI